MRVILALVISLLVSGCAGLSSSVPNNVRFNVHNGGFTKEELDKLSDADLTYILKHRTLTTEEGLILFEKVDDKMLLIIANRYPIKVYHAMNSIRKYHKDLFKQIQKIDKENDLK